MTSIRGERQQTGHFSPQRAARYGAARTDEPRKGGMTEKQRRARTPAAKPSLSSEASTAVAHGLLEREGMDGVALRRLAKELQTGPASLYAYVRALQELHALVLDRVLANVDLHPRLDDDPRTRLEAICTPYLYVLAAPRRARRARGRRAAPRRERHRPDRHGPGLSACHRSVSLRAAWGYDALMPHVTAIAAEVDRRRSRRDPIGRARNTHEGDADERFPQPARCTRSCSSAPRRSASRGPWTSC
ncbi:hypothetical protein ACFYMW_31375 [Streptomyces sp. NPDC006692]|uniref:hypothetical protein n=1 Tax=Streptomyces sp. NPDC006692 TaxID=3364758 RepID=UPI0036BE9EE3